MNHREFIANIAQHPADMGPRLVYADWLEERGDVRSEFIRLAIELAKRNDSGVTLGDDNDRHGASQCGKYHYMHLWKHGGPDYYEADSSHDVEVGLRVDVRKVVSLSDYGKPPDTRLIHGLLVRKVSRGNANRYTLKKDELTTKCTGKKCPVCNSRMRCAALLAEHRKVWTTAGLPEEWTWCNHHGVTGMYGFHVNDDRGNYNRHVSVDFARGFPEILTLRWEEWQRHYRTLIDAMPVREVRLTTPLEFLHRQNGEKLWRHEYQIIGSNLWHASDNLQGKAEVDGTPIVIRMLLAAEFPGHDPAHPIKYTLPVDHGRLPRGIDPRGVMTGNEAISVTVPTIFPTPTINIGGIQ